LRQGAWGTKGMTHRALRAVTVAAMASVACKPATPSVGGSHRDGPFSTVSQVLSGTQFAAWSFSENTGSIAIDRINAHLIGINSTTWAPGYSGTGLQFYDGDHASMDVSGSSQFASMTSQATIEGWFKPQVAPSYPYDTVWLIYRDSSFFLNMHFS